MNLTKVGWAVMPILIVGLIKESVGASSYIRLRIPQGEILGKVLKSREGKHFSGFMGIPFAQPPERFEFNVSTQQPEGSEDCLFLNVFTPTNAAGNLSVIAYIHGGAFRKGLVHEHGPEFFMDHDVVLVTIGYRLGPLGFLTTGDGVVPGNLGLKDQVLALRWIQDNIEYFGGSKSRMTLVGESAGAGSVSFQILSPLSKGLFRHAISQSGTALDRWAVISNHKEIAEGLAGILNCPITSSQDMISCLKEKSAEEIVYSQGTTAAALYFAPVVENDEGVDPDSVFLPDHPRNLVEAGQFEKVPLLLTLNDIEGIRPALETLHYPERIDALNSDWDNVAPAMFYLSQESSSKETLKYATDKLRDYYFGPKLVGNETLMNLTEIFTDSLFLQRGQRAALMHAKHAPVYTAVLGFRGMWSYTHLLGFTDVLGMTHADDIFYLFPGFKFPTIPSGSESEQFSKLLINLWVNFANTGDPGYEIDGRKWLPIQPEEIESEVINWLYLKNDPEFAPGLYRERMLLWDHVDEVLRSGLIP